MADRNETQEPTHAHQGDGPGRAGGDGTGGTGGELAGVRDALADTTQAAQDLADQLRAREAELAHERARADRLERRGALERAAASAGAIDAEACAMLCDSRLAGDADATPERVVAQLKRERPALFRAGAGRVTSMSPAHPSGGGGSGIGEADRLREAARSTGDRRALMRYLRLRRRG